MPNMNLKLTIPVAVVSSFLTWASSTAIDAGRALQRLDNLEKFQMQQIEANKEMLKELSAIRGYLEYMAQQEKKRE